MPEGNERLVSLCVRGRKQEGSAASCRIRHRMGARAWARRVRIAEEGKPEEDCGRFFSEVRGSCGEERRFSGTFGLFTFVGFVFLFRGFLIFLYFHSILGVCIYSLRSGVPLPVDGYALVGCRCVLVFMKENFIH